MSDLLEDSNKLIRQLTEQYPDISIQLFASYVEGGETKSIRTGIGNWYARQGMAHEFINSEIAEENARQLADQINKE